MAELDQDQRRRAAISRMVKRYRGINDLSKAEFANLCCTKRTTVSKAQISKIEKCLPVTNHIYSLVAVPLGFRGMHEMMVQADAILETVDNKPAKPVEQVEQNESPSDEQLIKQALARFDKTVDKIDEATEILRSSEKLIVQRRELGRVLSNSQVQQLLSIFKQIID